MCESDDRQAGALSQSEFVSIVSALIKDALSNDGLGPTMPSFEAEAVANQIWLTVGQK